MGVAKKLFIVAFYVFVPEGAFFSILEKSSPLGCVVLSKQEPISSFNVTLGEGVNSTTDVSREHHGSSIMVNMNDFLQAKIVQRVSVFENRLSHPFLVSVFPDRQQIIKTECYPDSLKNLKPEKEFRYNAVLRKRQEKYFPNFDNKIEKGMQKRAIEKKAVNKNPNRSEENKQNFTCDIDVDIRLPLLDEYQKKMPMIWFLKSEKELESLTFYFKRKAAMFGVTPNSEKNKLLIALEDELTLSFSASCFLKNKDDCVGGFLSQYFDFVVEPEEVEVMLKSHQNLLKMLKKVESSNFCLVHDSFYESSVRKIQNIFKKLGLGQTIVAGVSCAVLKLLNNVKQDLPSSLTEVRSFYNNCKKAANKVEQFLNSVEEDGMHLEQNEVFSSQTSRSRLDTAAVEPVVSPRSGSVRSFKLKLGKSPVVESSNTLPVFSTGPSDNNNNAGLSSEEFLGLPSAQRRVSFGGGTNDEFQFGTNSSSVDALSSQMLPSLSGEGSDIEAVPEATDTLATEMGENVTFVNVADPQSVCSETLLDPVVAQKERRHTTVGPDVQASPLSLGNIRRHTMASSASQEKLFSIPPAFILPEAKKSEDLAEKSGSVRLEEDTDSEEEFVMQRTSSTKSVAVKLLSKKDKPIANQDKLAPREQKALKRPSTLLTPKSSRKITTVNTSFAARKNKASLSVKTS